MSGSQCSLIWSLTLFLVVGSANPAFAQRPSPASTRPGTVAKTPAGIEFVWIPAGEFTMGSPQTEKNRYSDEGPQRRVSLSGGFWIGKFEITQGQWRGIMGNNPSAFKDCGDDCPVEMVSWNDAKEFITKLNSRNDGYIYALPSEAQWEYAARAGTATPYAYGETVSSKLANFNGEYFQQDVKGPKVGKTTKVGSYPSSAWGLHDMFGNVWEWVEDVYSDSYAGLPTDGTANLLIGAVKPQIMRSGGCMPMGAAPGGARGDVSTRSLRGGAWISPADIMRSATRNRKCPEDRTNNTVGLRLVARPK